MLTIEQVAAVDPTLRKRGRRRRTATELVAETENSVADLDRTVAVTIRCLLACAGAAAVVEKLVKDPNCVAYVDFPVVVRVTSKKRGGHNRRTIDSPFDKPINKHFRSARDTLNSKVNLCARGVGKVEGLGEFDLCPLGTRISC